MIITSSQIGKNGRFGNQLFQIAACIGHHKKWESELRLPNWYCGASQLDFAQFFPNYIANPLSSAEIKQYEIENYQEPQFSFQNLPRKSLDLIGFFQSHKYFEPSYIVPFFTTGQETELDAVCLHIRRGDYLKHSHMFPLLKEEYYRRAYKYFGSQRQYFVFSDSNYDDIKNEISFIKNKEYVSTRKKISPIYEGTDINVMQDFNIMKSCRYHIIANSSFSWWSAYLSQGEVVSPNEWFHKKYGKQIGFKPQDLILNNWKCF
jgi:hypothetical protein